MLDTYNTHRAMDPMAEFLAQLTLDTSWLDDETSSEPVGWFGRVGRRIVHQTPQGFVNSETYDTEAMAVATMEDISRANNRWYDDQFQTS